MPNNALNTARQLIERHGLRAAAVAEEHAAEARVSGETAALDHWRAVAAAVAELKRTERAAAASAAT